MSLFGGRTVIVLFWFSVLFRPDPCRRSLFVGRCVFKGDFCSRMRICIYMSVRVVLEGENDGDNVKLAPQLVSAYQRSEILMSQRERE